VTPPPELVASPRHVKIGAAWAGLTLLQAVRRAFPETTPREVFKLARTGELLVNDARADPLGRLAEGDVVRMTLYRPPRPEEKPLLVADQWVKTPVGPLWIVREDEDLLVLSKSAGTASHPALGKSGDTLVERVRHYLGETAHGFVPALANRLDIGTSGIVLVGKNKNARGALGFALQRGRVEKFYLALVAGWVEKEEGEIDLPLEKKADSRDLATYPPGHPRRIGRVQEARTRYRVAARSSQGVRATLAEVELLTGRTHQIRRHFAAAGHPVAGDARYGDREINALLAEAGGLERMFLHAHRVRLDHPATGARLDIRAPLPEELRDTLRSLGIGEPG